MIRHSLEELEAIFGSGQAPKCTKRKPQLKRVEQVAVTDQITISDTHRTLLGDEILPFSFEDFADKCAVFRDILKEQNKVGVSYQHYFLLVTFFTQLRRPDLAHEFARLHPLFGKDYDTSDLGKDHTQAIIDKEYGFFEGGGKRGYLTYSALGYENICNHGNFSQHSSPIRHFLLKKKSVSRFVGKNPVTGSATFVSALAVAEINRCYDLLFHATEAIFYEFNGIYWEKRTDAEVTGLVDHCLGTDSEPAHTSKTIDKLKATNLVSVREFVAPQDKIAFKNGLLDISPLLDNANKNNAQLSDLSFKPFSALSRDELKKMYLVGTLGANFDRESKLDKFQTYLDTTFEGSQGLMELAREIAGYVLIPQYQIHAFFIFKGPGGNGKGVYLHILGALVGPQNVVYLNFANFNRFSTSALQHKLLNITDELPKKANWDLLKNLSGGGYTEAEQKNKPSYHFRSTAKFGFSTNGYPQFSDASQAFWTRCIILPFNNSFRGTSNEISAYEEILLKEIDAIALWALYGLISLFKRRRFIAPPEAKQALNEARLETDSVRAFVDSRCILDARLGEFTTNLYQAYSAYCIAHNNQRMSHKNFLNRLCDLGVKKNRLSSTSSGPRRNFVEGIGYDRGLGESDIRQCPQFSGTPWLHPHPEKTCARSEELIKALSHETPFPCKDCSQYICEARNEGHSPENTNSKDELI